MPNLYHVASIGIRGISNCILNRALSVSFEVTRSCNASCKHCHLKGSILEEEQASAEDYAKRCCELKPYVVAMLSGGEPLLRKDLEKIIKALKEEGKAAYITVSTNGALLDKQRYDSLREAGIDLFSISFDYPDKLHDTFRGIPGLLSKILKLLKDIQHLEDNAITFCCVVQKDNYKDLPLIAEFARKWRVKLNLSTYTWLRTNRKEYMISNEELAKLEDILDIIREHKKKYNTVIASEYMLKKMLEYFKNQEGICKIFCVNFIFTLTHIWPRDLQKRSSVVSIS